MKRVFVFFKALRAFFGVFFGRRDPVLSVSSSGNSVLPGWSQAPEDLLLGAVRAEKFTPKEKPVLALFCVGGPHQGELKFVGPATTTLGSCASDSLVLTPENPANGRVYRAFVQGSTATLMAESGTHFRLNGSDTHKAELLDFDMLELFGNRFLVLASAADAPGGMG